jgi:hypothetical protein
MRNLLIIFAASAAVALCTFFTFSSHNQHVDAPSHLSIHLAHGDLSVRVSSFAQHATSLSDLAEMQLLAASVTEDDARTLSDDIFEHGKFSLIGSHNNGSSAYFSTKKLRSKSGDKQYFIQFTTHTDIYTLAALAKFTNHQIVSHVQENLFIAVGSESFASKARRFPGVAWVQQRTGSEKFSGSVRQRLQQLDQDSALSHLRRRLLPSTRAGDGNAIVELMVQCWYDACGVAAVEVKPLCPVVYVQAQIIEVHCSTDVLARALSLLGDLVGVEHVEMKQPLEFSNFAGAAIVGSGPSATSPAQSSVLSNIDVSSSLIGVADSGINMNNCFFYDDGKTNNSRVVSQYTFLPCEMCGRCCIAGTSPSGCSNAVNACGNTVDQSGHGTHVCGTIAGSSPDDADVSAGDGIAAGARLYFQDVENALPSSTCYRSDTTGSLCKGLGTPAQLSNLFDPAYNAGVCGPPVSHKALRILLHACSSRLLIHCETFFQAGAQQLLGLQRQFCSQSLLLQHLQLTPTRH